MSKKEQCGLTVTKGETWISGGKSKRGRIWDAQETRIKVRSTKTTTRTGANNGRCCTGDPKGNKNKK